MLFGSGWSTFRVTHYYQLYYYTVALLQGPCTSSGESCISCDFSQWFWYARNGVLSVSMCVTKRNSDPPNRLSLHQYTCACISLALWEQEKCGSELGRCQGPAVWESTRLPCCRYSCAATVERFAIQPHCVRDTRLLQAPAEDTTFCYFTQLTELRCTVIMSPPLIGGAFSDAFVWCLTVAYIGPKSRTERHRKTKIGTEVAHVTRDSDTTFEVKRSRSPGRFTQCGLNE